MIDRACENCFYVGKEHNSSTERTIYSCHRYAPRPTNKAPLVTEQLASTFWPLVEADDWCGKYKSREDEG